MKNELVVKSNQVIEASYRLSVVEQRVILSAIAKIPKMCEVSDNEIYSVSVQDLQNLGIHEKTAYRDLKEAVSRLYDRSISLDLDDKLVKMRWVQRIEFTDSQGIIALRFSKDILPFISNLKANFTQYLLSEVSKMQGVYSVRIYELLIQYKEVGGRLIAIDDLRKMLDLGKKYNTTGNFIAWVITPAIEEINEFTDLRITVMPTKTGRKFTHINFIIKKKANIKGVGFNDKSKENDEIFYKMSDAQINMFGNQLAQLPDLAYLAVGNESYEALASRIKKMLKDPIQQKQFLPFMRNLGFKS
ncbi:replication initiation protein RepM [Acinetobacter nectaris]|uniref:replication initiation protein RepM n=1 Tax=Acinetobacter nectaris TaxID=1219382 RepID=UPI001F01D46E|nr:replication initiation protein RepM [Acinetobacter nectaris]MCF9047425.1 replication initiation protein [Acinetobacter nectaris]